MLGRQQPGRGATVTLAPDVKAGIDPCWPVPTGGGPPKKNTSGSACVHPQRPPSEAEAEEDAKAASRFFIQRWAGKQRTPFGGSSRSAVPKQASHRAEEGTLPPPKLRECDHGGMPALAGPNATRITTTNKVYPSFPERR